MATNCIPKDGPEKLTLARGEPYDPWQQMCKLQRFSNTRNPLQIDISIGCTGNRNLINRKPWQRFNVDFLDPLFDSLPLDQSTRRPTYSGSGASSCERAQTQFYSGPRACRVQSDENEGRYERLEHEEETGCLLLYWSSACHSVRLHASLIRSLPLFLILASPSYSIRSGIHALKAAFIRKPTPLIDQMQTVPDSSRCSPSEVLDRQRHQRSRFLAVSLSFYLSPCLFSVCVCVCVSLSFSLSVLLATYATSLSGSPSAVLDGPCSRFLCIQK